MHPINREEKAGGSLNARFIWTGEFQIIKIITCVIFSLLIISNSLFYFDINSFLDL
jgi:hypothetical protein